MIWRHPTDLWCSQRKTRPVFVCVYVYVCECECECVSLLKVGLSIFLFFYFHSLLSVFWIWIWKRIKVETVKSLYSWGAVRLLPDSKISEKKEWF